MVGGGIAAGGDQSDPLGPDDALHQDAEGEKQGLVEGRQVDPGAQRDEEHLLDQQRGVDEDAGDPGPKSHRHT